MRGLKRLIHGSYARLLDKALNRPVPTVIIAILLFSVSLAVFNVIGFSLFPASEKPQFFVNITAPPQSNLAYTDSISRVIEAYLKKEHADYLLFQQYRKRQSAHLL